MVNLGPIRSTACAILDLAQTICEDAGENHAARHVFIAIRSIRSIEHPNPRDLIEAAESFDPWTSHEDVHPYLQNVSRFCADVLRWTHEEERRREIEIIRCANWIVQVDPVTRYPIHLDVLAYELERVFGYRPRFDGDRVLMRQGAITIGYMSRLTYAPN